MQIILYVAFGAVIILGVIIALILRNIQKKIKEIRADISFLEREDDGENWDNLYKTVETYQFRILDGIGAVREIVDQLNEDVEDLKDKVEKVISNNNEEVIG